MDREQALKEIGKLHEAAKELVSIEKDIVQKKGEKAQLARDIQILKNGVASLNTELIDTRKSHQDEIANLERVMSQLKSDHARISSDVTAQRQGVDNDRATNERVHGELLSAERQLQSRENSAVKSAQELAKKLDVINQIVELAKGL